MRWMKEEGASKGDAANRHVQPSLRRSVHCAGVSGGELGLAISWNMSHEASLTAFAHRGHLASRHRGARMFIVGIMNVIIQCYPHVGNFKSIKKVYFHGKWKPVYYQRKWQQRT